jgi:SAM-dependent methyltransferase
MLIDEFVGLLKERFDKPGVLDVGCGPESELKGRGLDFVGIDFVCSGEGIICADFLKHEFDRKFEGIFVKDVLHLFPRDDWSRVFEKVKSLLVPGGLVYFCLKVKDSGEGFVECLEGFGGDGNGFGGFRVLEKGVGADLVFGKRELELVCGKR